MTTETIPTDLLRGHEEASRHRQAMDATSQASCFCCERTFPTRDIEEWCDGGETAICPKCGVDAVLPGVRPPAVLKRLHDYWFAVS